MPQELSRDRASFGAELSGLVLNLGTLRSAEFLVTGIETKPDAPGGAAARTVVRYDLVGSGKGAWRAQSVGHWRLSWRRGADQAWQIAEWTAMDAERSRAAEPVFTR